ncbi:MAG: DUF6261 family protein [Tannerellaceae bacterium]|jgi:hypothetical protein|nr:DUF6261 family protein [Tannerellaceae bacterium]
MRIGSIDLLRLRNEEWYGIFVEFIVLVLRFGADKLKIAELFALFVPLHEKSDKLLEVIHKSEHTAKMKEADKKRNSFFRGLYDVVKTSRKLEAAADRDAAERLYILLSTYRKTAIDGSYSEESSAIYNLLQDLNGKYAADITLLGLGKWVANLSAAEQTFRSLWDERLQESADKPKEQLKAVRKQADALYRSMADVLYAKLMADGLGGDVVVDPDDLKTGPYEDSVPEDQRGNVVYNFVIIWNEVIKKYHNTLAIRAGQHANKEKDPDGESDQPQEG